MLKDAACECQPGSHLAFFKQLLSMLTKKGANLSMQDHFQLQGGLCSVMTEHFQEIQGQCSDHGKRPCRIAANPEFDQKAHQADFNLD